MIFIVNDIIKSLFERDKKRQREIRCGECLSKRRRRKKLMYFLWRQHSEQMNELWATEIPKYRICLLKYIMNSYWPINLTSLRRHTVAVQEHTMHFSLDWFFFFLYYFIVSRHFVRLLSIKNESNPVQQ